MNTPEAEPITYMRCAKCQTENETPSTETFVASQYLYVWCTVHDIEVCHHTLGELAEMMADCRMRAAKSRLVRGGSA